MNLAVFVKQVPDTTEADLAVAPDGRSVRTEDAPLQLNEWDRFALEEAVLWKERTGGALTAFLVGPEEHEDALRRCLAVGADRAVRVWDPALPGQGPCAVARVLRAAVGNEPYDLFLCGAQAADDGFGLVGPLLAEELGVPSATLVSRLEPLDGRVRCTRELEAGWGEVVDLDLPALVTIQTGINEPRYVSILGIRKARKKPIDLLGLGDVGLDDRRVGEAGSRLRVVALSPPPAGREAEFLEGPPDAVARRVVDLLREKVGVL